MKMLPNLHPVQTFLHEFQTLIFDCVLNILDVKRHLKINMFEITANLPTHPQPGPPAVHLI